MSEKINLEEIIFQENKKAFYEDGYFNGFTSMQRYIITKCMLEFGKQLLELAAENAKINCKLDLQEGKWVQEKFSLYKSDYNDYTSCTVELNKQSILDTINQVE